LGIRENDNIVLRYRKIIKDLAVRGTAGKARLAGRAEEVTAYGAERSRNGGK
jgi:hypothetical protein